MHTLSREKSEKVLDRGVSYLKTAHSCSLQEHHEEIPRLERASSARIRRVSAYPVMVPDLSVDMVEEELMRRSASALLTSKDPNCFKRRNLPESTGDWFESKHRVRHFLNTMHPYRDPLDKYKKFTKTRIPLRGDDADDLLSKQTDFLMPRDLTHARKTGYNPGHIRSVLQLDTYGPAHSAEVERQRNEGLLPVSPNLDRNRDLRTEVCSASNSRVAAQLQKSKSAPNRVTIKEGTSSKNDSGGMGSPNSASTADSASNNIGTPPVDRPSSSGNNRRRTPRVGSAKAGGRTTLFRPGSSPSEVDTLPRFEDRLKADSTARRLEWHRNYIRSVEEKQHAKILQEQRENKQKKRENEAREVGCNIKWFENRLNTIHNSKSDSKF